MTHGIRIRIGAFLVLSAVGIVYVAASYLGLVDRVLGRGITVHATLPTSGGLFEGSEVTYRGVQDRQGLQDAGDRRTASPSTSPSRTAPSCPQTRRCTSTTCRRWGSSTSTSSRPTTRGPTPSPATPCTGTADSLPVDEADLLVELDQFVSSVDKKDLQTVVHELGTMFDDTGVPLQQLLDNGSEFIRQASAHTAETIALLDQGKRVLTTQQGESENIRSLSRDLHQLTERARAQRRRPREGARRDAGHGAGDRRACCSDLEPTLPVLLANAVSVNQVVVSHLAGVEQLLVTYPRVISAGFTGTPGDGYGHVNLQLD